MACQNRYFLTDNLGLIMSSADDCFYAKQTLTYILIVALYVACFQIACNENYPLENLKMKLCKKFEMKDLRKSHMILGIAIYLTRKIEVFSTCKSRYGQIIIGGSGLEFVERQNTPMDDRAWLLPDAEPSMESYLEALGFIKLSIVSTCFDLEYSVCTLAKLSKVQLQFIRWLCKGY